MEQEGVWVCFRDHFVMGAGMEPGETGGGHAEALLEPLNERSKPLAFFETRSLIHSVAQDLA